MTFICAVCKREVRFIVGMNMVDQMTALIPQHDPNCTIVKAWQSTYAPRGNQYEHRHKKD